MAIEPTTQADTPAIEVENSRRLRQCQRHDNESLADADSQAETVLSQELFHQLPRCARLGLGDDLHLLGDDEGREDQRQALGLDLEEDLREIAPLIARLHHRFGLRGPQQKH